MARVVLTASAFADLDELVRTHRLPPDTRGRVAASLRPLADFPELGGRLGGTFAPRRFVLGPWRWMIVVYRFDEHADLVAVLAIVDARSSNSPLANR